MRTRASALVLLDASFSRSQMHRIYDACVMPQMRCPPMRADASAAAPAADAARRDVAAALVLAAALAVTTVCGQCHAFGKAWCRETHGPPAATAI